MNIDVVLRELLLVLSGALVCFILLELGWPGTVLAYLNINWVLLCVLAVGIVILARNRGNNETNHD